MAVFLPKGDGRGQQCDGLLPVTHKRSRLRFGKLCFKFRLFTATGRSPGVLCVFYGFVEMAVRAEEIALADPDGDVKTLIVQPGSECLCEIKFLQCVFIKSERHENRSKPECKVEPLTVLFRAGAFQCVDGIAVGLRGQCI